MIRLRPWAQGREIWIYDVGGTLLGVTQTHEDYPKDTVEVMARDWLTCTYDELRGEEFVLVLGPDVPEGAQP